MTAIVEHDRSSRYLVAPHSSLAVSPEAGFSLRAEQIIRLSCSGLPEFLEKLNATLLPSPTGRTAQEIATALDAAAEDVLPLLDRLVEIGVLIHSKENVTPFALLTASMARTALNPDEVQRNLDNTTVQLVCPHPCPLTDDIAEALKRVGVQVSEGEEANLTIVIGASARDSELFAFNRKALEQPQAPPWLSIIPFDGNQAWVGPFQLPHRSACYTCFQLRLSSNFSDPIVRGELIQLVDLPTQRHAVFHHPLTSIQAGITAHLVAEWAALRGYAPSVVPGGVTRVSVDSQGISLNRSRLLRVPRCPDCSPARHTGFPQTWFHSAGTGLDDEAARDPAEAAHHEHIDEVTHG